MSKSNFFQLALDTYLSFSICLYLLTYEMHLKFSTLIPKIQTKSNFVSVNLIKVED